MPVLGKAIVWMKCGSRVGAQTECVIMHKLAQGLPVGQSLFSDKLGTRRRAVDGANGMMVLGGWGGRREARRKMTAEMQHRYLKVR